MFSAPRVLLAVTLITVLGFTLLLADSGANHQVRNQHFGVSGGNVNNHSNAFCCSGTLGSLVTVGTTQYILSNNHILADVDQAQPGEHISQPGLIDNSCRPATTVADFTAAPALGTANVDAAIAALRNGTMDSTGYIEDIGVPNDQIATAAANMDVAKSGRTTGLTCGRVQSVNTNVKVQYQLGCNKGKKLTISYTNQIVVGSGFSAGGDSGSLIVTQSNASPAALLYAGSSTTTIGNPVQDVLGALSDIGFPANFAGSPRTTGVTCTSGGGGGNPHGQAFRESPDQGDINRATAAKERHASRLMADPAVMAVGVGADNSNPSLATIVIYIEEGRSHAPIPAELDGVPTQIVRTDLIRAYGWNEAQAGTPQSCSAKTNK